MQAGGPDLGESPQCRFPEQNQAEPQGSVARPEAAGWGRLSKCRMSNVECRMNSAFEADLPQILGVSQGWPDSPTGIRHSSLVIRHSSFVTRHSAFEIRHSAFEKMDRALLRRLLKRVQDGAISIDTAM